MSKEMTPREERGTRGRQRRREPRQGQREATPPEGPSLGSLQRAAGNRAVQRLIAQGSGQGAFQLDQETESRINRQRTGGQPLDSKIQKRMEGATGHDLSGVRVHTSKEADALSRDLRAKAFTTGQHIFFRQGAYDPHSSSGQELLAHELTHVLQQSSGRVSSSGRMKVNPPGDALEQEADAVARALTAGQENLQRQPLEEEEEEIQMQALEEEEETLQMQMEEEDEELLA